MGIAVRPEKKWGFKVGWDQLHVVLHGVQIISNGVQLVLPIVLNQSCSFHCSKKKFIFVKKWMIKLIKSTIILMFCTFLILLSFQLKTIKITIIITSDYS